MCSFPASMCQLWMPFNKSILFLPAHRYNIGRCSPSEWHKLNQQVTKMASNPKHVVAGMSRYDTEYMRYYIGLETIDTLSSLSGFYTQGYPYKPKSKNILLISRDDKLNIEIKAKIKRFHVGTIRELVSILTFKRWSIYSCSCIL